MDTLDAKLARYPYAAARLDDNGRVLQTCEHDHGRQDIAAIACARDHGWDGFAELLVVEDAVARPLDVWRFWDHGGTTRLQRLGVINTVDIAMARPRP